MKIHLSPDEVRKACILYVSMTHPDSLLSNLQFGEVEFELGRVSDHYSASFDGAFIEIIEEKDEPTNIA